MAPLRLARKRIERSRMLREQWDVDLGSIGSLARLYKLFDEDPLLDTIARALGNN
jgi:hypothetical protein